MHIRSLPIHGGDVQQPPKSVALRRKTIFRMSWRIRCLAFVSSVVDICQTDGREYPIDCQPRRSEAVQSVNAFGYFELVPEKGRSNHTGGGLIGIQHLRGCFRLCFAYGLSQDQSRFIRCTETELPVVHPEFDTRSHGGQLWQRRSTPAHIYTDALNIFRCDLPENTSLLSNTSIMLGPSTSIQAGTPVVDSNETKPLCLHRRDPPY
ncbi:hypothetical protein EDB89DRAFT_1477270 [Lactarius sanguifluus]|nr:hypothetical protein EDB89DRAFT_1477270 [Lactarius sanguifluus]